MRRIFLSRPLSTVLLELLLHLLLVTTTGDAINPGCRCIRFASTFGKEWGSFGSPDYPSDYYPAGIGKGISSSCLLYLFSAPPDFIVQLNFTDINLPTTGNDGGGASGNGCYRSGHYLKLFLHLETEGVNESSPWNTLICGQRKNQTFFSASRHLVIQFHTASLPLLPSANSSITQEPLGFHGVFRFLNSSQYESNGRLVAGTKCDYTLESRNYSSPEGKFFSPLYPSTYPHNVMCTYTFRARLHERVKILFEYVALEPGIYSCLNKTDIITVYDGPTPRSPVIALICNVASNYEILSTSQDLLIHFIANSDNPGQGFQAKFHFIKVIYEDPYDPMKVYNNLEYYFPKALEIPNKKSTGEENGQPKASTLEMVPQCDQVINSDTGGPNGSFSSPSYPNPYQPKSHCRYDIIGHGRQKVQISFVDFNLFHTQDDHVPSPRGFTNLTKQKGSSEKCPFSDTISAFIYAYGERIRLLEHCGLNPPPVLMSNTHRMTLEFNAKASTTTPPNRGFYAHYSFVEDYGIKMGLQVKNYPCAFIFNISSYPNGTGVISSPNYPGLYPRDTECHYFFHGDGGKSYVQIVFDHFDVLGVAEGRCSKDTDDYIEYSSTFHPTSTTFQRKCGKRNNLRISGGGRPNNFFRLTFRSGVGRDDGWTEGTGFRGTFAFITEEEGIVASSKSSPTVTIMRNLVLMFFLIQDFTVHFWMSRT